ncbi:hypothetical protein A676_04485 [Salmonella enterica subsp. enterica serovar Enteritidis str. 2010K-0262]|nr:hypothetical protein A676_04485 [Salmonella enterica subsp. enterica serovar Enteritidis str. 2010K-0262]
MRMKTPVISLVRINYVVRLSEGCAARRHNFTGERLPKPRQWLR